MEITRDPPEFRPVTVRIETQDELDMLLAIISTVAQNKIHHAPPVVRAAVDIERTLTNLLNEDN